MKKSIVWLASYPKSGNTWARIFLANYLANRDTPLPINEAHRFCMGDTVAALYHRVAGRRIDVTDVPLTLHLRPAVLRGIVANNADVNFVKTHNICRNARGGGPLIPAELTRSAIYIVRNPLDMVLSYARHYGMDNATAVTHISHPENANAADGQSVAQFLGTWSDHVESWTAPQPFPVLTVRYEDLLDDPAKYFAKMLTHIGVPVDDARLARAIEFASFKELSKQEEAAGFVEKSAQSERFFARGKSRQWETDLDPDLVQRVKRAHRKVMKKHGYL